MLPSTISMEWNDASEVTKTTIPTEVKQYNNSWVDNTQQAMNSIPPLDCNTHMNNVDWPGLVDGKQRQSHHSPMMNEATAITDGDERRRNQQRQ